MASTQPARGMRDFLPADVRRRDYVIGVIKEVYERYGFEPLETPAVENIETLMGKYGEEGNQLIFKILKRGVHEKTGEADLALRYDLTVPLARVVAQYQNELPKFFKRYQIQPVWRADRPARGRFREFYQCDVDVLGSRSPIVEAELCSSISDVLIRLGFRDFTIRLNHRLLLDAMMSSAMIDRDQRSNVLVAVDKLDKIGEDGVRNQLALLNIIPNRVDTLLHLMTNTSFLSLEGKLQPHNFSEDRFVANKEWLTCLARNFKDFSYADEGKKAAYEALENLEKIVDLSEVNGAREHIKIDPSLARGLSYYTGSIMEVTIPGLAGSVGGGGRYDNLVGMFRKDEVPACGFSFGLERIILLMTERKMFPPSLTTAPADVMVLIDYSKDESKKILAGKNALKLARELRDAGLRVDVYPARNVKNEIQKAHASKREIPFIAWVGEDEILRGEVKIRNLRTRDERSIARIEAAKVIQEGK
ncbi:MAG: histidyl-tRNA synthetase [Blastocatellia bacterium]|jgi:histidyl-tRNA synthetase|nr:histidyl-tRNA synthetase [Blastocatellia bacterium]